MTHVTIYKHKKNHNIVDKQNVGKKIIHFICILQTYKMDSYFHRHEDARAATLVFRGNFAGKR